MGRSRFIVCYDIADAKRLRRVFKTMKGFGDALQYSVFTCDLSAQERVLLEEALVRILHAREDRVLIIDAGPTDGRGDRCLTVLGRQEPPGPRQVTIV